VLAAAAVFVLAGCAAAPPGRTSVDVRGSVLLAQERIAQFSQRSDEAVADLVPDNKPGCSAAVGVDGKVLWAGAGGLADLKAGTPVTTETRFDIASVSKQFTATAILMLQREGLLDVDDPIGEYVGGLPPWGATVTLDQLIHHTSHVPDFWVELDNVGIGFADAADQKTTLRAIARETRLDSETGFAYSNSNYVLLAEVVARVSGQPLPEFLAERIFEPLGLEMVVDPTLHAPDVALAYGDNLELEESGWTAYGHTGIITTPTQLALWGDQYRTGPIVQDDFDDGAVYEAEGEYYAAAMDIEVDGDLNHTGRWGGYVSDFTVSADRDTTIAVVCNGHLSNRFGLAAALWKIWDPAPAE
jgi:CubicO group peptidase (beta-lactamase class C family)